MLAGVNGTDPFCIFDRFLDALKAVGFSGVQNFPTVGLIDGIFRANLEETGMYVMDNTEHCHGFYGASSMERLPVESALTEQTRRFKH